MEKLYSHWVTVVSVDQECTTVYNTMTQMATAHVQKVIILLFRVISHECGDLCQATSTLLRLVLKRITTARFIPAVRSTPEFQEFGNAAGPL